VQKAWAARFDGLADAMAEAQKAQTVAAQAHAQREVELQRLQGELERLRSRPWWQRLFGAG
jgi:hypothetical protein